MVSKIVRTGTLFLFSMKARSKHEKGDGAGIKHFLRTLRGTCLTSMFSACSFLEHDESMGPTWADDAM